MVLAVSWLLISGCCFASRSRHTSWTGAWSSDLCSSDLVAARQADSGLAAELVGLAEAQRAAGVSPAIDVTRARAQLATAQGLLLVAKNQLDRGRIDVARALGLDPATPLA